MYKCAHDVLREVFGFHKLFPYQEEVINSIVNPNDKSNCLVLMSTGSGKSLCYQIPALMLDGLTLVVSPLIALMVDQVNRLRALGVPASFLASSLDEMDAQSCYNDILQGKLKILYITPEKLGANSFVNFIARTKVSLLAIDEAHCVSQWGHDFRPEYQKISIFVKRFPHVKRIALTATADEYVMVDIKHVLSLNDASCFIGSLQRHNFVYAATEKNNAKKQLVNFLSKHQDESGIVYCATRNNVDKISKFLVLQGFDAHAYHAGLDTYTRSIASQEFLKSSSAIMVATVAFGLGIDKPNVRFIYHFDMPSSIEQFYQESGRGGRDGETAYSVVNFGFKEIIHTAHMIINSDLDVIKKRYELAKLKKMAQYCENIECRYIFLHGTTLYNNPCGVCDNCSWQLEQVDYGIYARQILFTVKKMQHKCNIALLLDILRGKLTLAVKVDNHHLLPTFGALKGLITIKELRRLIRSLYCQDYLDINYKNGNFIVGNHADELILGTRDFYVTKLNK